MKKIQIPTTEEIKGKKATIVSMNSIGFVSVSHVTLFDMQLDRRYQSALNYDLAIWSIEKGKRKISGCLHTQVSVFEGWQTIEERKESIIHSFDNDKFESAKARFKNVIIEHESEKALCYLYN